VPSYLTLEDSGLLFPVDHCNYLLIYEYVVSAQSANMWKSIARAFATKHLDRAKVDEVDEPDSDDEFAPAPTVNKNQDRTLLLGGKVFLTS